MDDSRSKYISFFFLSWYNTRFLTLCFQQHAKISFPRDRWRISCGNDAQGWESGIDQNLDYDEIQFHKTRKCWYPANKLLVWLTFSVNAVWMLATSCKFDRVTRLLLLHLVVYGRDGTSFKSIDIAWVSYKYRLNQKFVHKFDARNGWVSPVV